MHPQAPALVQHGSPRGKQALVHVLPPHDVLAFISGFIGGVLPPPELGPVLGSVDPPLDELPLPLPMMHEPKLQTCIVAVQSVQALPLCPHAVSSVPLAHAPFEQHPLAQVFGLQPAAAWPPLPPLESSPVMSRGGGVLSPVPLLPPLLPLPLASLVPPASSTASKPPFVGGQAERGVTRALLGARDNDEPTSKQERTAGRPATHRVHESTLTHAPGRDKQSFASRRSSLAEIYLDSTNEILLQLRRTSRKPRSHAANRWWPRAISLIAPRVPCSKPAPRAGFARR